MMGIYLQRRLGRERLGKRDQTETQEGENEDIQQVKKVFSDIVWVAALWN